MKPGAEGGWMAVREQEGSGGSEAQLCGASERWRKGQGVWSARVPSGQLCRRGRHGADVPGTARLSSSRTTPGLTGSGDTCDVLPGRRTRRGTKGLGARRDSCRNGGWDEQGRPSAWMGIAFALRHLQSLGEGRSWLGLWFCTNPGLSFTSSQPHAGQGHTQQCRYQLPLLLAGSGPTPLVPG